MRSFALAALVVVGGCSSPAELGADDGHAIFDTVVDRPSSERTFTFQNAGGSTTPLLTTQLSGDVGPFWITADACGGTKLRPHDSCDVTVRLASDEPGSFDGELHVDGMPLPATSVLLSGKVTPVDLTATARGGITANILQGGDALAAPLEFAVHNRGGATSAPLLVMLPPGFVDGGDCGNTRLAGGALCTIALQHTPVALDQPTGTFMRTFTVTDGVWSRSIDLIESINAVGALTMTPASPAGTSVPVGTTQMFQIDVYNGAANDSGPVHVSISEAADDPMHAFIAATGCDNQIAMGGSCRLTVSARPTMSGFYRATVELDAQRVHSASMQLTLATTN